VDLYDWNTVPSEQLTPAIARQAIHRANMTVARLELKRGATVAEHSHVHEQISMVQQGALKFVVAGREQIVRAGGVLALPSGVPHAVVETLEDAVVVDVFSPVREDWIRGDDAYLRR
jgi:quercetin dioxygenase-like cupin family protein